MMHAGLVTDSILVFLVAVITFIIRMVFKPSEGQVKLLSNILIGVFYFILNWLESMHKNHKEIFVNIEWHIDNFKNKINRKRVGLG